MKTKITIKILRNFFKLFFIIAVTALICGSIVSFISSYDEEVIAANYMIVIALVALSLLSILCLLIAIAIDILGNPERESAKNLTGILGLLLLVSFLFTFISSIFPDLSWIKYMYTYQIYEVIFDVIKDIPTTAMTWYSFGSLVILLFTSIIFTNKPKPKSKSEPELVLN